MINEGLKEIVSQFSKSIIQSEAEVRSKLIVPLIEWLGYPSELRSEEYPIYGFEGGKKLPAKNADFLMFDDPHFALYRGYGKGNIEWVQSHSLLVFEAKKPGEIPEVLGQPQYYSMWSRSIAYLETDGKIIHGYVYDELTSDRKVISCTISDLPNHDEISLFAFEKIRKAKSDRNGRSAQEILSNSGTECSSCSEPASDESQTPITYPNEVVEMTRAALGKNSSGLSDCQAVETFLRMTDSYLQNDMRYDIPKYMESIPRRIVKGNIYIDKHLLSLTQGEITQFYCNDYEAYQFQNDFLELVVEFSSEKISYYHIRYFVTDALVVDRIRKLEVVSKLIKANRIVIAPQSKGPRIRDIILTDNDYHFLPDQDLLEYWLSEQEKMRVIEEYYNIQFHLSSINSSEDTFQLYTKVDYVYASICYEANCHIDVSNVSSRLNEAVIIEEPTLVNSSTGELSKLQIHNYVFQPEHIYWLPTVISKGTEIIDVCVTFTAEKLQAG